MKRTITTAAAVALAVLVAPPMGASATPSGKNQAQVLGPVRLNEDGTASVKARYICNGGEHLWVSAKQSESGRPDPRLQEEGSSGVADGWMQSHPAPSEFTCDGTWHTDTFTIETANFGPGAEWNPLEPGQAWVQFCVVDFDTEELLISDTRWASVR